MIPSYIDTHSHLHFSAYHEDRTLILEKMEAQHALTVTVGTNEVTSQGAIELAEASDLVFASVGYHPTHMTSSYVDEYELNDPNPYSLERLRALVSASDRVVAVGETGLDYTHIDEGIPLELAKSLQATAFRDHLRLAYENKLPVIIHCRDAFTDLLRIIDEERARGIGVNAVVHCYTGDWTLATSILERGLMISFTGIVTFKPRAKDDPETLVQRVIERMPPERMMLETDCPWLSPEPLRGQRNDPTTVPHIAKKIAELRNVSAEDVLLSTTQTALEFFQLHRFIS